MPPCSLKTAGHQHHHSLVGYGRDPLYLCEPCDAAFEGLRSALEAGIAAHCIDLDVHGYPDLHDDVPDPYAITRIGLKQYYNAYDKLSSKAKAPQDTDRELHMARRLKELCLTYERVLFVGGMSHIDAILKTSINSNFPSQHMLQGKSSKPAPSQKNRAAMLWQKADGSPSTMKNGAPILPLRQTDKKSSITSLKLHLKKYTDISGNPFPGYNFRNLMKFLRNYSLLQNQLMPDLFQIITAAKGCVDHNYAYEVWQLATDYPFLKNIDALPSLDSHHRPSVGRSKKIHFHMKSKHIKSTFFPRRTDKSKRQTRLYPPALSQSVHSPEDVIIEKFGEFLKKKGSQILREEGARTIPFSTSLEDGVDTRETVRHWSEKKLYVKTTGKPTGGVGSVVIIFDEDAPEEESGPGRQEKYPWETTWLENTFRSPIWPFMRHLRGIRLWAPGSANVSMEDL